MSVPVAGARHGTACYGETYPAPIGPSQSDFGGVGLLQTPTARMAREGELSLNYRDNDQYRYYSASVQLPSGIGVLAIASGSSRSEIYSPVSSTTARSTAFSSSRIFPGQS